MFRTPNRGRKAKKKAIPAPIGGLNARDSLAAMPPTDAVTLDNFFPTPTTVDLRKGYVLWSTGYPAAVESLLPYRSSTVQKLFAVSGTAIYDATAQGPVGAAAVSGITNARWQSINVGTPGGQFMMAVNGAEKLRGFDGTNWWQDGDATHDITGFDTSKAAHINLFKNRVFMVEKNSFRVWYLPVNSIAGGASSIEMSPLFKKGGYMMSMATWTIDNANGVNEYAAFISSEGEVVIYLGTDPSVAGNWTVQGTFVMGRPIGRRCHMKYGSDVLVICADGLIPLSKVLLTDRQEQDAISYKIINLINRDVQNYAGNFGWEMCHHPIGNKLIVNVPQTENSLQYQYVMNTVTGAWSRFTNWNANTFALLQDALYFGSNLGSTPNSAFVAKADYGYSDNGAYVFGEAKTAFSYFDAIGEQKVFQLARLVLKTAGNLKAALGLDVDFADSYPSSTPTFSGNSGTPWNTAPWNTFPWGDVSSIKKDWQGIAGVGDAAALHLRMVNNASETQWMATEFLYQVGAGL